MTPRRTAENRAIMKIWPKFILILTQGWRSRKTRTSSSTKNGHTIWKLNLSTNSWTAAPLPPTSSSEIWWRSSAETNFLFKAKSTPKGKKCLKSASRNLSAPSREKPFAPKMPWRKWNWFWKTQASHQKTISLLVSYMIFISRRSKEFQWPYWVSTFTSWADRK